MKNQLKDIKKYLEIEPRARERVNRYKAIRRLLVERHPMLTTVLQNYEIERIVKESLTIYRAINRVQQLYPELHGTDYDTTKKILQQQTQIDLDYRPGNQNEIKTLEDLTN